MDDENYLPECSEYTSQPQSLIIIYDPPEIMVVRDFSRILIPCVDPVEYYNEYCEDLLETDALLNYCLRLGIPVDK
ncbi:unnamed protein product, partial [Adineta steineri]